MKYFLGFDGGGTKTDGVLMDAEGRVLAEARAGPSNPARGGSAKACVALGEAAQRTLAEARISSGDVRGVCAGLAGASQVHRARRVAAFFERAFPGAAVRVTSDLEIALAAAVGVGEGVVLVAGTGSAAFGRLADGRTARAGGLGPKTGDEGSAFDVGRRAIAAAALTREGRGPETILAPQILHALGLADWHDLSERIARAPDEIFPRVFPAVLAAAEAGDALSREILAFAAEALAALAVNVAQSLGLAGREFVLAKSGGVFGRSAFLDQSVDARILAFAPHARITPLEISPAHAAADLARLLPSP